MSLEVFRKYPTIDEASLLMELLDENRIQYKLEDYTLQPDIILLGQNLDLKIIVKANIKDFPRIEELLDNEYKLNLSEIDKEHYLYGFNGKESDNEVKGNGNSYDFGARIYDPRIGRWLAVDPLARKYTDLSPYSFAANMPIQAIDPDGKRVLFVNGHYQDNLFGKYILGANKGGKGYWGKGFEGRASKFFNDYSKNHQYIDGSSMLGIDQSGQERKDAGYEYAKANFDVITADMVEGETFKIVTHSEGAAYGAGIAEYLLEKKIKVEVVVHLSADEGDEFETPKEPTTYQFGYSDDWVTGNKQIEGVDKSGVADKGSLGPSEVHGATKSATVFDKLDDLKTVNTQQNLNSKGKTFYTQQKGSTPKGTNFKKVNNTPMFK